MDTQETLETLAPILEEAAPVEVAGESDKEKVTTEAKEQEVPEPPTPRIPKKRAPRPSPIAIHPPPIADHKFWSDMLMTKRELDREAGRSRYANVVKC